MSQPRRTRVYRTPVVDGARWDRFEPRPDDVFVCTPSKHGTTWMQTICALLIFRTPELDFNPAVRSRWLDATFQPIEEVIAELDAQTERRVIKTHTPFDGVPYWESCTYLTVYRDPRDAFFSMLNHVDNMRDETFKGRLREDPEENFREWVDRPFDPEETFSLEYVVHHFETHAAHREVANLHFFHYADMKRDLPAAMREVARALGIEVPPDLLGKLAEAGSFEHMKRNADRFAPGADRDQWRSNQRFFHKGASGQWAERVSRESAERFDAKLETLLGPERARWLCEGGGPLP